MKAFVRVMKALSDPNRVKILKMLQHKTMCVCEMREALQVSQPSVSKNLKILEDAGLVASSKDGLWVNYSLDNGGKSPYAATLLGNLRHWLDDEPEVAELIERLPTIRREEVCGSEQRFVKLTNRNMGI
ncbi:MAG: ArsR family transcriptional regulator [Desulfobacteraceae bacterium]|nr:MAG: ArsR family transcriptional regulator [Desulfobacteraceae bacterium]